MRENGFYETDTGEILQFIDIMKESFYHYSDSGDWTEMDGTALET